MTLDPGKLADLLPCPFCGVPLTLGGGVNPWGRCDTPECWMNERKLVIALDEPTQIAAWNTRALPSLQDEDDLVRRLRDIAGRAGIPNYVDVELLEAATTIQALRMRVATYERRLEIDRCWAFENGEKVEKVVPPEERDSFPDGIECRNETIKLLDRNVDALRADVAKLGGVLSEIESITRLTVKSDKTHCIMALDAIQSKARAIIAEILGEPNPRTREQKRERV
jgi:hypothetical protein